MVNFATNQKMSMFRNKVNKRLWSLHYLMDHDHKRHTFRYIINTKRLLVNCRMYGLFYGSAEFTHQTLAKFFIDKEQPYDFLSIGRYWLIGSTYLPALKFYWYRFVDKILVGKSRTIIFRKILLDRLILSPLTISLFYIGMAVLEGKRSVLEDCQKKLLGTYVTSCVFWFPALAISYLCIAPKRRLLYSAICSFVWTNILCLCQKQEPETQI